MLPMHMIRKKSEKHCMTILNMISETLLSKESWKQ